MRIGVIDGMRPRKSGSQQTLYWRKADSNSRSRSCESVSRVLQKGDAGTDRLGGIIERSPLSLGVVSGKFCKSRCGGMVMVCG